MSYLSVIFPPHKNPLIFQGHDEGLRHWKTSWSSAQSLYHGEVEDFQEDSFQGSYFKNLQYHDFNGIFSKRCLQKLPPKERELTSHISKNAPENFWVGMIFRTFPVRWDIFFLVPGKMIFLKSLLCRWHWPWGFDIWSLILGAGRWVDFSGWVGKNKQPQKMPRWWFQIFF